MFEWTHLRDTVWLLKKQSLHCACKWMPQPDMGQMLKYMAGVHERTCPIHAQVFNFNPFHLYQCNSSAFSRPEQGFTEACILFFRSRAMLIWMLWRMLCSLLLACHHAPPYCPAYTAKHRRIPRFG